MCALKAVNEYAGVVQWLESQPSKLVVWVRFPSPAPEKSIDFVGAFFNEIRLAASEILLRNMK